MSIRVLILALMLFLPGVTAEGASLRPYTETAESIEYHAKEAFVSQSYRVIRIITFNYVIPLKADDKGQIQKATTLRGNRQISYIFYRQLLI